MSASLVSMIFPHRHRYSWLRALPQAGFNGATRGMSSKMPQRMQRRTGEEDSPANGAGCNATLLTGRFRKVKKNHRHRTGIRGT